MPEFRSNVFAAMSVPPDEETLIMRIDSKIHEAEDKAIWRRIAIFYYYLLFTEFILTKKDLFLLHRTMISGNFRL